MKTIVVTGGAGFIGSCFIRSLWAKPEKFGRIINLDKLTYAGNLANLPKISAGERHRFVHGDICDKKLVEQIFAEEKPDVLVNFAADTHVDRSIGSPNDFIQTDVFGVFNLLENARKFGIEKFVQISTDEVYGSIESGSFSETDPLMPRNPYSAAKAGGDRLAYSYFATYEMPIIITRASNNYGSNQYPEKLIPLFVTNLIEGKKVPLYGDGKNIRDWLFVQDHCDAIEFLLENGENGEVYNVGGGNEMQNIEITRLILELMGVGDEMIKYVPDRPGHDQRYSLNTEKLAKLGWKPQFDFQSALPETVRWYRENDDWWRPIKSGEYLDYYKKQYGENF